jgi:hypothetical protein
MQNWPFFVSSKYQIPLGSRSVYEKRSKTSVWSSNFVSKTGSRWWFCSPPHAPMFCFRMLLKHSTLFASYDATAEVRSGLTGLDEAFPRQNAVLLYGYLQGCVEKTSLRYSPIPSFSRSSWRIVSKYIRRCVSFAVIQQSLVASSQFFSSFSQISINYLPILDFKVHTSISETLMPF